MRNTAILSATLGVAALALVAVIPDSRAQRDVAVLEPEQAQAELERATRESDRAETRAARLAAEADAATEADTAAQTLEQFSRRRLFLVFFGRRRQSHERDV